MNRNTWVARARVLDGRLQGRPAIFEAARTLFALQGFAATPVMQIGHAVGMRTGSLYTHIESKQELLLRIVAGASDLLRGEIHHAFNPPRAPAEALRAAAFCHIHAHAAHPWDMLILGGDLASVEGPLPGRVRARQAEFRSQLLAVIERGQTARVFEPVPAEPVADLILGAGLVVAARTVEDEAEPADELALAHADLALRLVGAAA